MKLLYFIILSCYSLPVFSQNVGVGTNSPQKRLSVNGSIMLDTENKSTGLLDSAALLFGNTGKVGIAADKNSLNNGGLDFYTNGQRRISINSFGQVSVNTTSNYFGYSLVSEGGSYLDRIGSQKVNVADTLTVGNNLLRAYTTTNSNYVKIGPDMPGWTTLLQVNGGAAFNAATIIQGKATIGQSVPAGETALAVWSDAFFGADITLRGNNPTVQFQKQTDLSNQAFLQLSGDNLRMGTNSGNAAGKFIIRNNGGDRVTVDAAGNMDVQGNITADGNKGILTNSHGAGQLKYYTRTVTASTSLAAGAMSGEITVAFATGVFSLPPKVFAGDIVSTGGASGELLRTQLVIYGVTTTGCKVRVINNSNTAINYNTVWNLICVGE